MSENKLGARGVRRETLIEKIIRRLLETVGGSVDRVFGRGKKPDALPSTGDLAERLRKMIDGQARLNKDGRKLAPHLIRLKYAWGQSSDEFLNALNRLKNELLVVAIDHINDNRYVTLGAVKIDAKADILTEGFTMSIGFDDESLQNAPQVAVPVEIYAKLLPNYNPEPAPKQLEIEMTVTARFPDGRERKTALIFTPEKKENLIVGRMKECDLYLEDPSVSKHHASLVMNKEGVLRLADIGSTNGTSLNGSRIAYGKAYEVTADMTIGFGDVATQMTWEIPPPPAPEIVEEAPTAENENIQSFETLSGNIQIGVRTAEQQENVDAEEAENQTTEEADEAQTLVGEAAGKPVASAQEVYGENQMAKTANLSVDLATNELDSIVKGKLTSELDSVVGQPTTELETTINKELELPAETAEETVEEFAEEQTDVPAAAAPRRDFTQKLKTDELEAAVTPPDAGELQGFDSLLGKSPTDLPKKTSNEDAPPSK